MSQARVRLYVNHPLGAGQSVPLSPDQAHYLFGVMRLRPGSELLVFNGRDGEWRASVAQVAKRNACLTAHKQVRPLRLPPDLWLLFAPLKKTRTALVVEKAVEMGVARIVPVLTEYTNAPRLREDRLLAHAVEAAEQCGATMLPALSAPRTLNAALADWPDGRRLMFCDEALAGQTTPPERPPDGTAPGAILIGPEGGFSPAERALLHNLPFSYAVSLGPRILRADTAVVAALTLWQNEFGDW